MSAPVKVGHVSLVGAGPGDPALLTLRAAELIAAADVVAHDELISEAILARVPAHAELLSVGRRGGAGEVGYRLHPEVKSRALRGLRVVRLKAGDPLIFGRGGEEAEELAEAGIPFEIVPGVSAAIGAASYAGIPLTHRDRAAQVVITTGHRADGGLPPPTIVGGRTLVQYMAAHELEANLAAVVACGWPPSTPAALIASATTADERVITATLATLAATSKSVGIPRAKEPAIVIVGDVVALHATIDWRRRLPLFGRTIAVALAGAPAGDRAAEIHRKLRDAGAIVVELPVTGHGGDATVFVPARWPRGIDALVTSTPAEARALAAIAPESFARAITIVVEQARTVDDTVGDVAGALAPRAT
jgi:uroporphyrinogen III methyltransferase/synthase